jgi:hypothetical protein
MSPTKNPGGYDCAHFNGVACPTGLGVAAGGPIEFV